MSPKPDATLLRPARGLRLPGAQGTSAQFQPTAPRVLRARPTGSGRLPESCRHIRESILGHSEFHLLNPRFLTSFQLPNA